MKKIAINSLFVFLLNIWQPCSSQEVEGFQEVRLGEKVFLVDSSGSKSVRINNRTNINLKRDYAFYNLQKAKFDQNKLAEIVSSIFTQQKLSELQSKGLHPNPNIKLFLHLDRSGKILAVNYLISKDSGITLEELSILESRLKSELRIADFLSDNIEKLDYYSLNFSIRPKWVLEGKKWPGFN